MLKWIIEKTLPRAKSLEEAQLVSAQLCELVQELGARIEELDERLDVDSSNWAKPPSQDGPGQRSKRKRKPPSSRKKGGQPEHKKHQRPVLPEDEVEHPAILSGGPVFLRWGGGRRFRAGRPAPGVRAARGQVSGDGISDLLRPL